MSKLKAFEVKKLDRWFERQKRVLPWRDEPTLYRVWISEIMLQQTQVITVIPYFERFVARFPTVGVLAAASLDDVLLHWAGLGYYSRARNIHRTAQMIVEQGDFPRTRGDWISMPGVGEYTAGAILSIALDQPEAILDGNVERVLSRVYRVGRGRGDTFYKAQLWEHSRTVVSLASKKKLRPSQINQALMELGATVCTYRKPKCMVCPLSKECQANLKNEVEDFPPPKKPKIWIHVQEELHCVVDPSGRILLRRREKGEWRAGLWDLLDSKPKGNPLIKVGQVESRHVVTRHKISRTTHIWKTRKPSALKLNQIWTHGNEVAMGSALKRTLQMIRERYPTVTFNPGCM